DAVDPHVACVIDCTEVKEDPVALCVSPRLRKVVGRERDAIPSDRMEPRLADSRCRRLGGERQLDPAIERAPAELPAFCETTVVVVPGEVDDAIQEEGVRTGQLRARVKAWGKVHGISGRVNVTTRLGRSSSRG